MYGINNNGDICRSLMSEDDAADDQQIPVSNTIELVEKVKLIKEEGYLYFIDSDGDISRTKKS